MKKLFPLLLLVGVVVYMRRKKQVATTQPTTALKVVEGMTCPPGMVRATIRGMSGCIPMGYAPGKMPKLSL